MFCKFCGAEIPDGSTMCPKCNMNIGEAQNFQQGYNPGAQQPYNPNMQQPYNQNSYNQPYQNNAPASTGMKILSFFIPLAGIILFFVDRDQKPQSAKDCLKFALIAIGVSVALSFIWVLFIVILGASVL